MKEVPARKRGSVQTTWRVHVRLCTHLSLYIRMYIAACVYGIAVSYREAYRNGPGSDLRHLPTDVSAENCISRVGRSSLPQPRRDLPPGSAFPFMAMPQNLTGENGFCFTQTLDFSRPSPPPGEAGRTFATPSGREPSGTPLSNGTVSSGVPSPSDSCAEPLCSPTPAEEGTQFGEGIKYVSAEGEELACGWWGFTPGCLQPFNTSKGVLFFLCVASFLQGMTVNGFINTVITSIERRFDLRSYQSGLIASSYDIAACLCLTFVSYFGGNGHKPRWLGWGVLVMGLGSLVFSLPHFTTGRYEVRWAAEVGVCGGNQSLPCTQAASSLSSYR
ncbi:solute carrier organic anion transporter family member 4a1 [Limosa lapponica baueri]|uniref:Solute carrier organic anion transporter family member 4a1 n=1 Tax=Limosa lapponica baueri TaxID=1758121 RepID=A0A2I0TC64_LIMLA|nr:solute carrier organic anion transporter family member 4a1 [Limosa lapponica baueri]